MRRGAFAMVDALGFKGIWRRPGITSDVVLAKLRALSEALENELDESFKKERIDRLTLADIPTNVYDLARAAFLSDTIVVALAQKSLHKLRTQLNAHRGERKKVPPEGVYDTSSDAYVIARVGDYVASAMRMSSYSSPVLAYRGAISFGSFEMDEDGRFIVGPAVDDAAQHSALAQGAFVWLSPTALRFYLGEASEPPEGWQPLLPYEVPLKGGSAVATYVVSPFAQCGRADECIEVQEHILGSFSGSNLDVLVKRQQTERFLAFARDRWSAKPPRSKTIASVRWPDAEKDS